MVTDGDSLSALFERTRTFDVVPVDSNRKQITSGSRVTPGELNPGPRKNSRVEVNSMSMDQSEAIYRELICKEVGTYVIEDYIGSGGQAVVYRAHHDLIPKSPRALKVFGLKASHAGGLAEGLKDLKATAINHRSVVTYYDSGIKDVEFQGVTKQVLYIAMPLSTLGSCERTVPFKDRPLSLQDFQTMRLLLDGLQAIHKQDILHEDIKPANILQFEEDHGEGPTLVLKITDFGIARVLSALGDPPDDPSALTKSFAAPERFKHEHFVKSDIYSMGATLFYMITGKNPIVPKEGPTINFLPWKIAHESLPRPNARRYNPFCPTRLALLLMQMMAVDANKRPSLDECKEELQKLIDAIAEKKSGFPIPAKLNRALDGAQFPIRYVADFQGIFKPSVHGIMENQLFVICIKMGHIVFSQYKRLAKYLVERFSDTFSLYETWGMYDINLFIWNKEAVVNNLKVLLEGEFPDSEIQIRKAKRVDHFHNGDYDLPKDAHSINALAVQEDKHLPNLNHSEYLIDRFEGIPPSSIRAFTYVSSSTFPLSAVVHSAIVVSIRGKMAKMMKNAASSSAPKFHRINVIEFSSEGGDPTILLVDFVVSKFEYLYLIPTEIIDLAAVKTSTFIETGRLVIQSGKILFD